MRPDTQLSDEVATFGETACAIEASRCSIAGRTLPEPAEATVIFTLEPCTRRSRKVWALLTSEVRGCRFSAAQGRRQRAWVVPPSGGPMQVGTTPELIFRAKIGTDGKVDLGVAL